MMGSPNSAGQNKIKSSDDLTIVSPNPVRPSISPFEAPVMLSTPAQSSFPSATSSSGRNHQPYDVFINHYGKDTKHTVASCIYEELNGTGLKVFLDKDELKSGDFFPEALENAISSASVHIAIFSKNYAKSPWCLAELVFMLSLQPFATFIPIFYHVDPNTLRWAKGIYGDVFYENETKNRYTPKQLQSWKSALHEASLYTGHIINNQWEEEKTIMNVVNSVLKILKEVRLEVSKYPVGLDEIEEDFNKEIALQSVAGPIQIVGIWGMGGAGKTTLAKHIYNKNCSTINRSSFLFDVRASELYKKQKKLLEDLKLKDTNFDNMEEGKDILRRRLKSVSVLIVLDDVDHTDQLDALLPAMDSLGCGSLIIVTTRELSVLKAWGISTIYKIKPLHPSYAEELFCWHAFGQPSPFIDFKELAKKFIDVCCGLPLSLKVLGGLLHGENSKEYWNSQFDKVSKTVAGDIKSKLMISYDSLDYEEKEMFLDVACFFIGWTSSSVIAIWNGSKWSGLYGWKTLMNKCLIEINRHNEIRMHDHLRDLGREIANRQSPFRLWSKEQIIQIQSQQEAIQIRGIADAFGENFYLQHGEIILKTTQGQSILAVGSLGLKIFITSGDFINEECSELLRELVCFCWDNFAHKNLPSWFPLKEIRILELCEAYELEALWECNENVTTFLPLQLRQLLISEGYALKKINGLQRLTFLERLRIYDCTELKTLSSLAGATSLKQIKLIACYKLEKIESLEGLRSLETLKIKRCTKLNTLPSLAGATCLKEIKLSECYKLEKIESLEGLISLQTLGIYSCEELKALPSLAEFTSLEEINLLGCDKLEKIEGLEGLRSLKILNITYCPALHTLPSLAELTSLEEIELTECEKVEKVEGLEVLTSLKKLKVHVCSMRPWKLKLEQSERLEWVEVVGNREVVEASIREIEKWPREVVMCTLTVIDVMSLRNFFTSFPENMVEHSLGSNRSLQLRMPKSAANANANAILICFIINSIDPSLECAIFIDRGLFSTKMSNGEWLQMGNSSQESKWVWMGIFPQQSKWLHSERYEVMSRRESERYIEVKVKEGWMLRGTEQSIGENFRRLCQS